MKVYVDEMPKSCCSCPCDNWETGYCQIDDNYHNVKDGKIKDCPLKLIPTQMSLPNDKDINVPTTDTEKSSSTSSYFQNGNSWKEKWNKLKEWVEKSLSYWGKKSFGAEMFSDDYFMFFGKTSILSDLLDKMQQLEEEKEDV